MRRFILLLLLTTLVSFKPNDTVLICVSTGATKYHAYKCQGLKKCSHTIESVTLAEAVKRGYGPCGYCY